MFTPILPFFFGFFSSNSIISLSLKYFLFFFGVLIGRIFRIFRFFRLFFYRLRVFSRFCRSLTLFRRRSSCFCVFVRMRARSKQVWSKIKEGDARKAPLACSFSKSSRRLPHFGDFFIVFIRFRD